MLPFEGLTLLPVPTLLSYFKRIWITTTLPILETSLFSTFLSQSFLTLSKSWAEHSDFPFQAIGSTPDTDAPSLSFYVVEAVLPNKPDRHGIVQVVYYTNNPEAPPAFYQCGDMGRF